jgi:hypothetical protein
VERRDAEKPGDIAVFPLAFPLIGNPGALSAVVLLTGRAEGWSEDASIIAMIGLCLIITYIAMRAADILVRILGQIGADVVGRISGILLAGLAVQFIFDGIRGGFPQAFVPLNPYIQQPVSCQERRSPRFFAGSVARPSRGTTLTVLRPVAMRAPLGV